MAGGRVKVKEGERLDDENIERVMALFEADKPITIKAACEELNIAANGARLKKIFEEFKEKRALRKKFRDANRGKPATDHEISTVIENYLIGTSLKDIAEMLYRSEAFVKRIVEEIGVPQRIPGENYHRYSAHPDQCMADSFDVKELVWVQKYGRIAQVDKNCGPSKTSAGFDVYQVWILEFFDPQKCLIDGKLYAHVPMSGVGGFNAYLNSYELGSLKHLEKYNIDIMKAARAASGA